MIGLAITLCALVFGLVLLLTMRRMRKVDERSPYIGEFRGDVRKIMTPPCSRALTDEEVEALLKQYRELSE